MTLEATELSEGWEVACAAPGASPDIAELDGLEWLPARGPGHRGQRRFARRGDWDWHDGRDFDADDWWFRTRFDAEPAAAGEELILALDGIATVADVYLNGERVLSSDSMFAAHRLEVGRLIGPRNELAIHCRALAPLLEVSRRPRARWRTALVSNGNLRFYRTMLLGRAPGFAPGPAAVGPWKPVRLERRRGVAREAAGAAPAAGRRGAGDWRCARCCGRSMARARSGRRRSSCPARETHIAPALELTALDDGTIAASGELVIDDVRLWWPHTHGEPALYDARLLVGRRRASIGSTPERSGSARWRAGASSSATGSRWPSTACRCSLAARCGRRWIRRFRARAAPSSSEPCGWSPAAGMNMLRVPGIGCYESDEFYDLLRPAGDPRLAGLHVRQPRLPRVRRAVHGGRAARGDARCSAALGRRPSLAVLCGGSEVAQQVAMLGLDPQLANGPLYGELLPSLVAQAGVDAPYIPSTPWGGDLPFRPGAGVANYYGVGAYRRPLTDARLAGVRFAGECLAFANVPDDEALEPLAAAAASPVHHPRWKAGVPRDAGAGWDFDDVRDHYLRELFGVDPVALRSSDAERYLELSRAVSGEVMAEVFGEWRRAGSPCGGGLVLWLTDLMPGAGWGVLDHRGEPKVAYHHLRRALAPVAVWSTDEGLDGVAVHVANDLPVPLATTLRIALYRDLEVRVDEARHDVELEPHSSQDVQRRGDPRPVRRRIVGLPVRAARAGPDRGESGARGRRA